MKRESGHSEDYFNEYRDFWWNQDFLELMARRLRLDECGSLLDVGCGQCHWSRILVQFLKPPSKIVAVDTDPKWAGGSEELRAFFENHGASVSFKQGDAVSLPFDDDSFDAATCQTTLIHLREPKEAIAEMRRVVKPGGLVLCAEPNNINGHLVKSSVSAENPIEDTITDIRYAVMLERGKEALGKGDNSYGDLLPGAFAELGFDDIRVYLSDKASPLFPPYETPEQQAVLKNIRDWDEHESGSYDWAEKRRFLEALRPAYPDCFEDLRKRLKGEMLRFYEAVRNGSYHTGGGGMMYLVSGRKI